MQPTIEWTSKRKPMRLDQRKLNYREIAWDNLNVL